MRNLSCLDLDRALPVTKLDQTTSPNGKMLVAIRVITQQAPMLPRCVFLVLTCHRGSRDEQCTG